MDFLLRGAPFVLLFFFVCVAVLAAALKLALEVETWRRAFVLALKWYLVVIGVCKVLEDCGWIPSRLVLVF